MRQCIDYLIGRSDDWLIGCDRQQLIELTEQLYLKLSQFKLAPKILLAERDSVKFLAGFVAACAASCPVFLGNPNWVAQEWQQVFEIVQSDVVLDDGDWRLVVKERINCIKPLT